jgi:hypothetical protein
MMKELRERMGALAERLTAGETVRYMGIEDPTLLNEILQENNIDLANQAYINEEGAYVVVADLDQVWGVEQAGAQVGKGPIEEKQLDENDESYHGFSKNHPDYEVNVAQLRSDIKAIVDTSDSEQGALSDVRIELIGFEYNIMDQVKAEYPYLSREERDVISTGRYDDLKAAIPEYIEQFEVDGDWMSDLQSEEDYEESAAPSLKQSNHDVNTAEQSNEYGKEHNESPSHTAAHNDIGIGLK